MFRSSKITAGLVLVLAVIAVSAYGLRKGPPPTTAAPTLPPAESSPARPAVAPIKFDKPAMAAPSRLVPVPFPREAVAQPSLQAFIDRNATQRLPIDFPARVPTVTAPADIAWVLHVLHDATDLDSIRNEAANLLRRSQIPDLEEHLVTVLASPAERERFRSYAVQHLGELMAEYRDGIAETGLQRAARIRAELAKRLEDPHRMVRNEALLALTRERDPRALTVIRGGLDNPQWQHAPDVIVRCAKEANLTDLIPAIRPLAYSDNDALRVTALNVLAQWKDEASRPAFAEASRSSVARVQRAGELAIRLLGDQNP